MTNKPCHICEGTGRMPDSFIRCSCIACGGKGTIYQEEKEHSFELLKKHGIDSDEYWKFADEYPGILQIIVCLLKERMGQ